MSELNYSPESKQNIKDAIYTALYAQVNERYQAALDKLIHRNSVICGNTQDAVWHKGTIYRTQTAPLHTPKPVNKLDASLFQEFNELEDSRNYLNTQEMPYVIGYVNQILNSTASFEDYYDLLPDALHGVLDKMQQQCPCRTQELTQDVVEALKAQNQKPLDLLRQRLVSNLLMG